MSKTQITILSIATLLLLAIPAAAQKAPSGSYQSTCSKITMSGDTLNAVCKEFDGSPNKTSLANANGCIGDVGNVNGVLVCTGAVGSYYKTCRDTKVEGDTLTGTCQRRNGSWVPAKLKGFKGFQGAIANCDGKLQNGEC